MCISVPTLRISPKRLSEVEKETRVNDKIQDAIHSRPVTLRDFATVRYFRSTMKHLPNGTYDAPGARVVNSMQISIVTKVR